MQNTLWAKWLRRHFSLSTILLVPNTVYTHFCLTSHDLTSHFVQFTAIPPLHSFSRIRRQWRPSDTGVASTTPWVLRSPECCWMLECRFSLESRESRASGLLGHTGLRNLLRKICRKFSIIEWWSSWRFKQHPTRSNLTVYDSISPVSVIWDVL